MSHRATVEAELASLAGLSLFDAHSHTGRDVDGSARGYEEQLAALAPFGGRSVVFPFCVDGAYAPENARVIEECRRHPEQLVPFARLDPRVTSAAEAAAALDAGARGFKLHPRAEDFRLDHPGVEAIASVAAAAGVPVLIHAGVGVGSFGETIVDLAARHRDCPLIFAHAAVSDLAWLWRAVPDHPNLYFDTSWWNPSDLIALFALVPPGRIVFGSDEPYMDFGTVLTITTRCARFAGLSGEAIELVAGGQLENLLAGRPGEDAGPAPGPPAANPSPTEQRLAGLLSAAGGCMLGGGDPSRMVELARAAIGADGSAISGGSEALVGELIDEAVSGAAPWALAMALTLLLTPGVESGALVS
ncbi:MAG TPA: amidohydrolase family protein [Solirubrobacterales bacterium]|nr:amidohydrolase family protein [Solirubrobacterales bacterium]